jgi:hypothetical protein
MVALRERVLVSAARRSGRGATGVLRRFGDVILAGGPGALAGGSDRGRWLAEGDAALSYLAG